MSDISEYALSLTNWQKNILQWNFRIKIQVFSVLAKNFRKLFDLSTAVQLNPLPESQEMLQKVRSYNE